MYEPTGESGENDRTFTDADLHHIASLTGEGSRLHQLAANQSPDFTDELEKFLSTNRFTQAAQDLGDSALTHSNNKDEDSRQLPPRNICESRIYI